MSVHGTANLASKLISCSTKEASMKFTVPGIALAALIGASPVAFAQNTGYSGTTSQPGASVAKDDQTGMTTRSKKHTASYKNKHHAKAMKSKAQTTTGTGSASPKPEKDDTTPKSK
jgi:hypothetical protein